MTSHVTWFAVAAYAYAGLHAAHWLADHIVQADCDAQRKGAPTEAELVAGAHPWRGWGHCARHVATYTATQAVALVPVAVMHSAVAAIAALAVSAATHAVIDRRWVVAAVIRAKGIDVTRWQQAPYAIDQALHKAAMFVAACLGATLASGAVVAVVLAGCAALVGAGLATERRRAERVRQVVVVAPARPARVRV